MARPRKHEELGLKATTTLSDERLAEIAKAAADQAKVLGTSRTRLEKAEPGRLVFSVRGPGGLVEQMAFELTASHENGSTRVDSAVIHYKSSQSTFGGFIPTGPKKMLGIDAYRKWIKNYTQLLETADPSARTSVNGQLDKSMSEWL